MNSVPRVCIFIYHLLIPFFLPPPFSPPHFLLLPPSLPLPHHKSEKNESFNGYLKQLEEDQQPLRSLLNAPMERIRKYPGLIKNILKKTPPSSLNYSLVESTLRAVQKVCVRACVCVTIEWYTHEISHFAYDRWRSCVLEVRRK